MLINVVLMLNFEKNAYDLPLPCPSPERRGGSLKSLPLPFQGRGPGVRSETPPCPSPERRGGSLKSLPLPFQGRGPGG